MHFKQERAISNLSDKPLMLIDQFTYLGNNILSSKNDVNICLAKTWTAIVRLAIIGKSNHFDKIKQDFFETLSVAILLYGCTT